MNKEKIKNNIKYSAIQGLSWMDFCAIVGFAATYLSIRGYSSTEIGVILAADNIISLIIQPFLADLADRSSKFSVVRILSALFGIMAVCAIVISLTDTKCLLIAVLYAIMAGMMNASGGFSISLQFLMGRGDSKVNFGICRAVGSLCYAILASLLGTMVEKISENCIPVSIAIISALLFLMMMIAQRRGSLSSRKEDVTKGHTLGEFARLNPKFIWMMLAAAMLFFEQTLLNNFMIMIVENVGGGSAEMGYLSAVTAVLELPCMIFFSRLAKKFRCSTLLMFSIVMYGVKGFATFFASNMIMLFAAYAIQFFAFALYTPAIVHYAELTVAKEDTVKAQSGFNLVTSLGAVFSSVFGGLMIDSIGVKYTILVSAIIASIGAVIAAFALQQTGSVRAGKEVIDGR